MRLQVLCKNFFVLDDEDVSGLGHETFHVGFRGIGRACRRSDAGSTPTACPIGRRKNISCGATAGLLSGIGSQALENMLPRSRFSQLHRSQTCGLGMTAPTDQPGLCLPIALRSGLTDLVAANVLVPQFANAIAVRGDEK